jgi:hypothetical protein
LGTKQPAAASKSDDEAEAEEKAGRTQKTPALQRTQTTQMPMRRQKTEEPAYTFTFEFKDKVMMAPHALIYVNLFLYEF